MAKMQESTIAPVDMAQAAIGPGIGVYSRYEKITDMNDVELTVRDALKIINAELAEFFGTQTGRLDAASQFCVALFTQCGFNYISFGDANTLALSKNISVDGLNRAGSVISGRGEVRLRDRDEISALEKNHQLNKDWIKRLVEADCAWLWVQSLVLVFSKEGIQGTAELLAKFEGDVESLKNLAYRLYDICEKKTWSKEATFYNELVVEWQEILNASIPFRRAEPQGQQKLF